MPRPRPEPLSPAVTRQMQRMPRGGSVPEMALRRELHARGLRYTLRHKGLPARPDLVFTRARIAVFVDGCFWHRCPEHGTQPKNNHDWWAAKLDANVERDRRQDTALTEAGWLPLRFWEHQDPAACADTVQAHWKLRTGRPGVPADDRERV